MSEPKCRPYSFAGRFDFPAFRAFCFCQSGRAFRFWQTWREIETDGLFDEAGVFSSKASVSKLAKTAGIRFKFEPLNRTLNSQLPPPPPPLFPQQKRCACSIADCCCGIVPQRWWHQATVPNRTPLPPSIKSERHRGRNPQALPSPGNTPPPPPPRGRAPGVPPPPSASP